MIDEVNNLTDDQDWCWRTMDMDEDADDLPLDDDTLTSKLELDPESVEITETHQRSMQQFFHASLLEGFDLSDDELVMARSGHSSRWIIDDHGQGLPEHITASMSLASTSAARMLESVLGNEYQVTPLQDSFLVSHCGDYVILRAG